MRYHRNKKWTAARNRMVASVKINFVSFWYMIDSLRETPYLIIVCSTIMWRISSMAKMAKKAAGRGASTKRGTRESWSKQDLSELKKHSKSKTPVDAIAKSMGRSAGALRQKAYALDMPLGHRR